MELANKVFRSLSQSSIGAAFKTTRSGGDFRDSDYYLSADENDFAPIVMFSDDEGSDIEVCSSNERRMSIDSKSRLQHSESCGESDWECSSVSSYCSTDGQTDKQPSRDKRTKQKSILKRLEEELERGKRRFQRPQKLKTQGLPSQQVTSASEDLSPNSVISNSSMQSIGRRPDMPQPHERKVSAPAPQYSRSHTLPVKGASKLYPGSGATPLRDKVHATRSSVTHAAPRAATLPHPASIVSPTDPARSDKDSPVDTSPSPVSPNSPVFLPHTRSHLRSRSNSSDSQRCGQPGLQPRSERPITYPPRGPTGARMTRIRPAGVAPATRHGPPGHKPLNSVFTSSLQVSLTARTSPPVAVVQPFNPSTTERRTETFKQIFERDIRRENMVNSGQRLRRSRRGAPAGCSGDARPANCDTTSVSTRSSASSQSQSDSVTPNSAALTPDVNRHVGEHASEHASEHAIETREHVCGARVPHHVTWAHGQKVSEQAVRSPHRGLLMPVNQPTPKALLLEAVEELKKNLLRQKEANRRLFTQDDSSLRVASHYNYASRRICRNSWQVLKKSRSQPAVQAARLPEPRPTPSLVTKGAISCAAEIERTVVENYLRISRDRQHTTWPGLFCGGVDVVATHDNHLLPKHQKRGELPFSAGEALQLLDMSGSPWWLGQLGDSAGWLSPHLISVPVAPQPQPTACTRSDHRKSVRSPADKLRNVVNDIVQTEKKYVKNLGDIVAGLVINCESRPDLFEPGWTERVFGNIKELHSHASLFLLELSEIISEEDETELTSSPGRFSGKRAQSSCPVKIAECFNKFFNPRRCAAMAQRSLRLYSDYCNNHTTALHELGRLTDDLRYQHFFEACRLLQQMLPIPVESFLILPIQRICNYQIQLHELAKACSNDTDRRHVEESRVLMKNIGELVNERRRAQEALEWVASWQFSVESWAGDSLLALSGRLLFSAPLVKLTRSGGERDRLGYMFDRQLILCKKNFFGALQYKGRVHLDYCRLESLGDGKEPESGLQLKYAWKMKDRVSAKLFYFRTRTEEEKRLWLTEFIKERKYVGESASRNSDVFLDEAARQRAGEFAARTRNRQMFADGACNKRSRSKSRSKPSNERPRVMSLITSQLV